MVSFGDNNGGDGGIEGIDTIRQETASLVAHKQKYIIFDFKNIDPIRIRLVAIGGSDTSLDVRAKPSLEDLLSTYNECIHKINPAEPCFIVYDFGYYNDRDCYRDMVTFISYIPDDIGLKPKVAYASNMSHILDVLKVSLHIQTHEIDDLAYEAIRGKCMQNQR